MSEKKISEESAKEEMQRFYDHFDIDLSDHEGEEENICDRLKRN